MHTDDAINRYVPRCHLWENLGVSSTSKCCQ